MIMFESDEIVSRLKKKYKKKIDVHFDYINSINNKDKCQIIYNINLNGEYGVFKELNGTLTFYTNDDGKLKKWFENEGIKVMYPWTF